MSIWSPILRLYAFVRLFIVFIILIVLSPLVLIITQICPTRILNKTGEIYDLGNGSLIKGSLTLQTFGNVIALVLQKLKYVIFDEVMTNEKYPNHQIFKINPGGDDNKTGDNFKQYALNKIIDINKYTVLLFGSAS